VTAISLPLSPKGIPVDQGNEYAVAAAKWMETAVCRSRTSVARVLTSLPSQDSTIFERAIRRWSAKDNRGHLHAALSGARLDRAVLPVAQFATAR